MVERIKEKFSQIWGNITPIVLLILVILLLISGKLLSELNSLEKTRPEYPLTALASYPSLSEVLDNDNSLLAEAPTSKIIASITGEVKNPGVYEFDDGALINDLLVSAGGLNKNADGNYVSQKIVLAKKLQPNEQIYIPPVGVVVSSGGLTSDTTNPGSTSTKINLNTATSEQLQTLSGIGPATAEKIIAARPYSKIEDILNVSGIGEATLAKIKDNVEI